MGLDKQLSYESEGDLWDYLVEEFIAEIYGGGLLESITPYLKVIKIPFTKLANQDIAEMLQSLPGEYSQADLYRLEEEVDSIVDPFIKVQLPALEPPAYPLATVPRARLQPLLLARQQII